MAEQVQVEVVTAEERSELVKMASTLPQQAAAIKVEDEETKELANRFYLNCREARKKISEHYDPKIEKAKAVKKAADEARAALVKEKDDVEAPIRTAEGIIGKSIQGYVEAQAEIARIRQEEAEKEARKRQEEEALAAAVKAEEMGLKDLAERIIEEPQATYVAPILLPQPKVEGMAFVEVWSYQITDFLAMAKAAIEGKIPLEAIQPNDSYIGQNVRASKKFLNWPGVKVSMEKKPRATGGYRR